MSIVSRTRIELPGLQRFERAIRDGVASTGGSGPFGRMFRQWGVRYLAFTRRRFTIQSRGGGEWKPLAPSTIRHRRKGTGNKAPAILKDTGLMFNALTVGAPGNLLLPIQGGIRVGFSGASHGGKGPATIADIASFHNDGKGVPQRPILVVPDSSTVNGMLSDAQNACRRTGL